MIAHVELLGEPGQEKPPPQLHPRAEAPCWIPRLGHHQERLLSLLLEHGVTTTAAPLHYTSHNPQLALFPDVQAGLVLDPCTHLRQLPREQRAPAFRALPFGAESTPFDPDQSDIDEAQLLALVATVLGEQRAEGATLLLTPFHLTGGLPSRGRELELLLARASCEHFRAQRIDEPPALARLPVRRELYATIALRRDALVPGPAQSALAERYLALPVDGYWVKLDGFDEHAPAERIRAGGALLAALAEGGRPVVCCGAGQLHVGLLAGGISSSLGVGEHERFKLPAQRPEGGWGTGRVRPVYHSRLMRNFKADHPNAERAFRLSPCRCGRHPGREVPTGRARGEHSAVVRAVEANEACEGTPVQRREWLFAALALSAELAGDAGLPHTKETVFHALFEGLAQPRPERREHAG